MFAVCRLLSLFVIKTLPYCDVLYSQKLSTSDMTIYRINY